MAMAVTTGGIFGLQFEKFLKSTAAGDIASVTVYSALIDDTATPDFDAYDFWDPELVADEVTPGSGYVTGGKALGATPTIAVAAGVLKYDAPDQEWLTSTIADAQAAVGYYSTGTTTTDEVIWLSDFTATAATANGTFTIEWHTNGIFTLTY
jgi:hypothetical protein